MRLTRPILIFLLFLVTCQAHSAQTRAGGAEDKPVSSREYRVNYLVSFDPKKKRARVTVEIPQNPWVRQLTFNTRKVKPVVLEHNGELEREEDDELVWLPPKKDARLEYTVKINKIRRDGDYDAYITSDWVLMRGDNLVPPVRVRQLRGARSNAHVRFTLPDEWTSVNTPWQVEGERDFRITNSRRKFTRPTGWLIAGKLATRRERLGGTNLVISAPRGHNFRPMETLSFLTFIWPAMDDALGSLPRNLLITGGNEPFWRGGLSGPDSLFLHSGRPLVSENGTSTLIHELFHVVTGLRGKRDHDWIAEGLAEYYSVELLYRAGGLPKARRAMIFDSLEEWGEGVDSLLARHSKGPTTARAVLLFAELDEEIRRESKEKYDLDDLVKRLDLPGRVDAEDLRKAYQRLTGKASRTLDQALLRPAESS